MPSWRHCSGCSSRGRARAGARPRPPRAGAGAQLLAGLIASVRQDVDVEALGTPLTPAGASSLLRGRRAGGGIEAGSLAEIRQRLGGGPLPLTSDQLTFLGCVLVLGEPAVTGARSRGITGAECLHISHLRPVA